jgi:iron complex transport system ATP-binding protein
MVESAHAVVVCGVPFGPGNLVNLELGQQALDKGLPVLIMEGVEKRDYTAGSAAARVAAMKAAGAMEWQTAGELLSLLPGQDHSGRST